MSNYLAAALGALRDGHDVAYVAEEMSESAPPMGWGDRFNYAAEWDRLPREDRCQIGATFWDEAVFAALSSLSIRKERQKRRKLNF